MQDDFGTAPIQPSHPSQSARIQKQQRAEAKKLSIAQEASKINMIQFAQEAAFNPVTMSRRFETLEEKMRQKEAERKEASKSEEKVKEVEKAESLAKEFERRNPELKSRSLQLLLSQLKPGMSADELLDKAMKIFGDHSLADEALEYLEQTTKGEDKELVEKSREEFNNSFGREIRAGRNIAAEARAFSKEGLGTSTGLRDLYRDITGNPRKAIDLFNELIEQFSYPKMQKVIDFLLHSLGADLKSKGPSIAPGELHALTSESRSLLAILGVFRFFKGRMSLIQSSYERGGMLLPPRITFEMLAKMFIQFLSERYPSMEKVFQLSLKMGISAETLAQIILFTQMRDAVRGVAPKLFRTEQHRHDVLLSFMEALEELEDQMEEQEEEDGEETKEEED